MSFKNYILCIAVLLFTTGCTFKTPEYKVDNNIVNKLNNYDLNKVSLSSDINEISDESNYKLKIRAVDMISSYGNNYSDYVSFSLKQQLSQNDIYKENSNVIIKTKQDRAPSLVIVKAVKNSKKHVIINDVVNIENMQTYQNIFKGGSNEVNRGTR
jgi:hypothetical protein